MHAKKTQIRETIIAQMGNHSLIRGGWGKAAERIRRTVPYKQARNVMVSLDPSLFQIRLNVLSDRKFLILPSPGIGRGFFLLSPDEIPHRNRISAVQLRDKNSFAKKIAYQRPLPGLIDLMVTDVLAVSQDGSRLGDGQGHLDLQYAILSTLGWSHPRVRILAIAQDNQIVPPLPMDRWDVGVHYIITPQHTIETSLKQPPQNKIMWDFLTLKQIRRNEALFFLYRQHFSSTKRA